jgi:dTDP-4-dehydro-6-deoxy-alpha-D-glucopyranose 2,3-dehydratase
MLFNSFDLLQSMVTEENPFIKTHEVVQWIEKKKSEVEVVVEKTDFSKLDGWNFVDNNYKLIHKSGKFFSIEGIRVITNQSFKRTWDQPIINQPEIGFLGIITKKVNGILYFLLQAKIEPGNINHVQLSPTLQATKSNFLQVHGGVKPAYLDYFLNANMDSIILDQLQSEQGARFLKKRNRNIIIYVKNQIPVYDNFIWLTLGQIKKLILVDNLINMDTRTVISGIQVDGLDCNSFSNILSNNSMFLSSYLKDKSLFSFDYLISWITKQKFLNYLDVQSISLNEVSKWHIHNGMISRDDGRFFKVIGARISIASREVKEWCQPMIEPSHDGLLAFIVKKINDVYHFLVQAKLECGNFDVIELAPTVQCLTGDYRFPEYDVPFLELVLNATKDHIIYDAMQSEEGGRFYNEQNRNMIVIVDSSFPVTVPERYIWMTLYQLNMFIKFNNYLNIQARSLLSAVNFI